MRISVVVCAHNEQEWIGHTLASLVGQQRTADEIIVVDNASTDSTAGVVQQFSASYPQHSIRLVHEAKKGLYLARDTGWRAATGDVIVTTDADITFPADWLASIEQAMSDPSVVAIAGTTRYKDALPIANWVTAMGDAQRVKGVHVQFNGGNSAVRRHILVEIDGYAGKPPDAFEDQYLTKKVTEAGYTIHFLPDLKVWHTFRRFNKEGLWGYVRYIFYYIPEDIYPDHLSDESPYTASVVVTARNAERTILRCLESLSKQPPRPPQIVVADAGSTDGTTARVEAFCAEHPELDVRLVRAADMEAAREAGWRAATGDLVAFVDGDAALPDGWLAKIHAMFVVHATLGAVGGEVRTRRWYTPGGLGRLLTNMRVRMQSRTAPVLPRGMSAYRRAAVEKAGGRDAARLTAAGYGVRFKPDVWVWG